MLETLQEARVLKVEHTPVVVLENQPVMNKIGQVFHLVVAALQW